MPDEDDLLMELMMEASVRGLAGEAYQQVDATHATNLLEYQYGSTELRRLPVLKVDPKDPPVLVTVRDGRTLDLPNKEFARVDIAMSVTCLRSDRDETYDALVVVVGKMLDRELTGITNPKLAPAIDSIQFPVTFVENVLLVNFGLTYGLTINLGNYNFRKPTAGISESFHPVDLHKAWAGMVAWLMPRISAQVKKARTPAPASKDIGL